MRQNNRDNPRASKEIARSNYHNRQINKYINWAIKNRGYLKWHELVEIHNKHKIKIYD